MHLEKKASRQNAFAVQWLTCNVQYDAKEISVNYI